MADIAKDKIYVYTKRRARNDGISQFVELIPKLFTDMYMANTSINNLLKREKIKLNNKTLLEILTFYLETPNYIDNIENVTPEDIKKIKDMNIEIFKESQIANSTIMKEALIQHLFRGHGMQYGIYFSIKYAKDDIDFISKFKQQPRPTPEDRIIMFTTLENLVNHVSTIKDQQKFKLPLLYINSEWAYGKIDKENTIILEENKQEFIEKIKRTYLNIDKYDDDDDDEEIICQIPLPNTMFKFFYVSDYKEFKQKYLKYKQKYLKLKAFNSNNNNNNNNNN